MRVILPEQLKKLTNGIGELYFEEEYNLLGLINTLESRFNGFKARLLNKDGQLNKFVNFYVNGEDVRFLNGLMTVLHLGDEISIIPAVAGG